MTVKVPRRRQTETVLETMFLLDLSSYVCQFIPIKSTLLYDPSLPICLGIRGHFQFLIEFKYFRNLDYLIQCERQYKSF